MNAMQPARLVSSLGLILALGACRPAPPPAAAPFSVVEATFAEMQEAMAAGQVTSRELVQQYLIRIAWYEETLNATMTVNRHALEEADRLDEERRQGRVRGPLHGIPIALKDNIHTTDMLTTGGALAFEGYTPPYDATLVTLLREAGAVLLAKTVNTELANWVTSGMPANYSAVGGYGLNPYDPRRDPRPDLSDGRPVLRTGGSSSGIGTTANFWAASVGTDTSGSIISPSSANMLVGIRPTVGRISRHGIIPIAADQDTAGPMAKTVADVAVLLGAMVGASPDPHDPATSKCPPPPNRDYTPHLKTDGLKGARIGIPRGFYYERMAVPEGMPSRGALSELQPEHMDEVIAVLRAQGAEIIHVDLPSVMDPDPASNLLAWREGSIVLNYGMKRDFNAYLASLGPTAPVKTLTELREFNLANRHRNAIRYGQTLLDAADAIDLKGDRARYEADRAKDVALAGTRGLGAAIEQHRLDAVLFLGRDGTWIVAKAGYPTIVVPYGMAPSPVTPPTPPLPEGFDLRPLPYGVQFVGPPCSEPRLIELAYAFEQATRKRVPPPLFP